MLTVLILAVIFGFTGASDDLFASVIINIVVVLALGYLLIDDLLSRMLDRFH